MDSTIRVAKTKTLISFAVTAKLICVFVLSWFSYDAANMAKKFSTATKHRQNIAL